MLVYRILPRRIPTVSFNDDLNEIDWKLYGGLVGHCPRANCISCKLIGQAITLTIAIITTTILIHWRTPTPIFSLQLMHPLPISSYRHQTSSPIRQGNFHPRREDEGLTSWCQDSGVTPFVYLTKLTYFSWHIKVMIEKSLPKWPYQLLRRSVIRSLGFLLIDMGISSLHDSCYPQRIKCIIDLVK